MKSQWRQRVLQRLVQSTSMSLRRELWRQVTWSKYLKRIPDVTQQGPSRQDRPFLQPLMGFPCREEVERAGVWAVPRSTAILGQDWVPCCVMELRAPRTGAAGPRKVPPLVPQQHTSSSLEMGVS